MWPAQKCSCSTASSREGHSVGPSSPQGGAELGSGMMWPQEAGQLLTPCPRSAHGPSDPQLSEQRPTGPASGVTSVSCWVTGLASPGLGLRPLGLSVSLVFGLRELEFPRSEDVDADERACWAGWPHLAGGGEVGPWPLGERPEQRPSEGPHGSRQRRLAR